MKRMVIWLAAVLLLSACSGAAPDSAGKEPEDPPAGVGDTAADDAGADETAGGDQLLFRGASVEQLLGATYEEVEALLGEPTTDEMAEFGYIAYGDASLSFNTWSGDAPYVNTIYTTSLSDVTRGGQAMVGSEEEMTRIFGRAPDDSWVNDGIYAITYTWDCRGSPATMWVTVPAEEGVTDVTSVSVSWDDWDGDWSEEGDWSGDDEWSVPLDEALCGRWRASDGSSIEFASDGTLTSANFQVWPTLLYFHDWNKPYYVTWQASNGQVTFTSYFSETCTYELGTTSFYDSASGQWIDVDELSIAGYQEEARLDALTGDGIVGTWGWRDTNTVRTVLNADGTGSWLDHPISWWEQDGEFTMAYQGTSTFDYYILGDAMEFFFSNGSKTFVKVGD